MVKTPIMSSVATNTNQEERVQALVQEANFLNEELETVLRKVEVARNHNIMLEKVS